MTLRTNEMKKGNEPLPQLNNSIKTERNKMENKNNVTSMEEVKNKNEYEERMKKWKKEKDEINKQLKKKDYLITVYQKGDEMLSGGDHERQINPRRCYEVCSLEEIPQYISNMKQPFWIPEEGLSKKEIKNYPFKKKKWGRYWNVVIVPLSEEMEKGYVGSSKKGFFKTWRMIRDKDLKNGK